jgi:hypothetical protein
MCRLTPYAYAVVNPTEATMLTSDPLHELVRAHERTRHLREEASAEHLRRRPGTRRAVAESLRRAANRLDPAPLAHSPA